MVNIEQFEYFYRTVWLFLFKSTIYNKNYIVLFETLFETMIRLNSFIAKLDYVYSVWYILYRNVCLNFRSYLYSYYIISFKKNHMLKATKVNVI